MKLTSDKINEIIAAQMRANVEFNVIGVRRLYWYYIALVELTYKNEEKEFEKEMGTHEFRFHEYDTGWNLSGVKNRNGAWVSLEFFWGNFKWLEYHA